MANETTAPEGKIIWRELGTPQGVLVDVTTAGEPTFRRYCNVCGWKSAYSTLVGNASVIDHAC